MKRHLQIVGIAILILVIVFSTQVLGQFKDKGIRVGIAGGVLQGITKMDDSRFSTALRIFMRHNIADNYDGDFSLTTGGVSGNDIYQSDLWLGEYKVLYKPYTCDEWDPYVGAGLGLLFFNANPHLRNSALESDGYVGYLPITLGTEYTLDDHWLLDANVNLNYAFSNNIFSTNRINTGIGTGNDVWWGVYVGISYTISVGGPSAAELEAIRLKAEQDALHARELAMAEAKRVQDSINAVATAKATAEAARAKEAAEAQRIQDSVKAAAQQLAEPKKEVEVPKPEPPKQEAIKAEVGKAIVLEGVVFQSGKAVLSQESEKILSSAKKTMEDNPDITVEIRGYTDNVGNAKKNLQLSQSRAESIKAWLVKGGIAPTRITAKGYGEKNPIGDNKTAEGRKMNRRIEFFRTK
jgi:outer membrane protein OmpA-like peptidoglycan-associated protein